MAAVNSPERTYWYRCTRLLLEGGRAVLKEFLKQSYMPNPGSLQSFLMLNKGTLHVLYNHKIINQNQWEMLFPSADLERLDITLLSCIICNCITQPYSLERKAVDALRKLRNRLHGHGCTESMNKDEFESNWKKITTALSKARNDLSVNISLDECIDTVQKEVVFNIDISELETWERIDALMKEMEEQRKEIKEQGKEIKEQGKEIKEQGKEISNIKKRLSNIEKEDEKQWTLDEEVRSELQNCLVNYYKTLIKAPVTVTASSRNETEIDYIYATPKLKLIDHKALMPYDRKEDPLQLSDIFNTREKKCYNIYITGDAGIGKTSLCKYMVSSWCETHQKETFDAFKLALKVFDFLFYISLRHATEQYDIQKMIVSQILQFIVPNIQRPHGVQPELLLNKLFERFSEKCLIILDGLDEWTAPERPSSPLISDGVPGRNPTFKYTIVTFTRPWKLEELRPTIDRQIQITGVKDIAQFCMNLISYFNRQTNSNKALADFDACLRTSGLIEIYETPIILKYLICLWFNNMEFGKSQAEVYSNILELWFQIAEKREGVKHFEQPYIDQTIKTVEVFKKNGKCDRYKTLLKAVGELAFKTLTSGDEVKLVFNSSDEVTEDQMDICLKVGILTQCIIPDMTSEKKGISFPHKTFHEYFAALHMGWHGNRSEEMSTMTNVALSKIEHFIIFLNGLWPSVFEKLIENKLANMFDTGNKQVLEALSKPVQTLVMKCCIESINQHRECPKVHLRDIFYHPWINVSFDSTNQDVDKKLDFFNLISRMFREQILHTNGDISTFDFSKLTHLKGIHLSSISARKMRLSPVTERLSLNQINFLEHMGTVSLMKCVSNMTALSYLNIVDINCTEHVNNELCFLDVDFSKLTELSTITLENISVGKLTVSHATKSLTLKRIKFSEHREIVSLMESVSNMKILSELNIDDISCTDHATNEQCLLDVDLSKLTELSTIKLETISARQLCVSPVTMWLFLHDIKLSHHKEIVSLMKSLSDVDTLSFLDICSIYCSEHPSNEQCFLDVELSKLTKLSTTKLEKISVRELCLSHVTNSLTFKRIKMSKHSKIVSLLERVSNITKLCDLDIDTINCTEHATNEQCILDVDLSKLAELSAVKLENISVKELCVNPDTKWLILHEIKFSNHKKIVSLMERFSNMKTLGFLEIYSIYCSEHANKEQCFLDIDLSKQTKLSTIKLEDISVRKLCVSHVTKSLTFKRITFSEHREIVSLMKRVSSMTALRDLDIDAIKCTEHANDRCLLDVDLQELTELSTIKLKNVSVRGLYVSPVTKCLILHEIKFLKHKKIVSLMKMFSKMKTLRCLEIYAIYCTEHANNEQCFLDVDLSKHTELSTITLEGISIRKLCVSHVTKSFTLRSIKMSDHSGLVSLMESVSNMKHMDAKKLTKLYCVEHKGDTCFFFPKS